MTTKKIAQAIAARGGLMNQGTMLERYGISRARVSELADHPTFPEPVAELNGRRVWLQDDVDEWRLKDWRLR